MLTPTNISGLRGWEQITQEKKVIYNLVEGECAPVKQVIIYSKYGLDTIVLVGSGIPALFEKIKRILDEKLTDFIWGNVKLVNRDIWVDVANIHSKNPDELEPTLNKIYQIIQADEPIFAEITPQINESLCQLGRKRGKDYLRRSLGYLGANIEVGHIERKMNLKTFTNPVPFNSLDSIVMIKEVVNPKKTDSITSDVSLNTIKREQLTANPELVVVYKEMLNGQTTLNLSRKEIGDMEATALADALKDNRILHTIDLSNNKIGPVGTTALAEVMKVNETLRKLDLSSNEIGNAGAIDLSKILLINRTLESLLLHYCKIGDEGAAAIASSLMTNETLHTLELLYNQIGEKGGSSLAAAMKTNGMLTTFTQFGNKISNEDREIISQELKRNRTLGTRKNMLPVSMQSSKPGVEKNDSTETVARTLYTLQNQIKNGSLK
jgi:hypothetical protein